MSLATVPSNLDHLGLDEIAECYLSMVVSYPSTEFIKAYNDLWAYLPKTKPFSEDPDSYREESSKLLKSAWSKLTTETREILVKVDAEIKKAHDELKREMAERHAARLAKAAEEDFWKI